MSTWVGLHHTAALLPFGVVIHISPTCELNVFCSYYASILLFAFVKFFAGKINASLLTTKIII